MYAVSAPGFDTAYLQVSSGGVDVVNQQFDPFGMHMLAQSPFPTTRGYYSVERSIDCADGGSASFAMHRTVALPLVPSVPVPTPFGVLATPPLR